MNYNIEVLKRSKGYVVYLHVNEYNPFIIDKPKRPTMLEFFNISSKQFKKLLNKYRNEKFDGDAILFFNLHDANSFVKSLDPYIIAKKLTEGA